MTDQTASAFYQVYEVFSQRSAGSPMVHQFSLLAPNEDMALLLAKENFFRREPCTNLWVVRRDHIRMTDEDERLMFQRMDKVYRETKGYGEVRRQWRKYISEEEER
ncbi:1,2-phenylacetyl-CoA epoxidase subunit PaaB [Rubeoparvulum massiliense]|uniref:1,2-phenylacetyl-CoA epoxidase subunit PaaB n=1 Tax=Rubeoparvulum massiliense TaxID=1631346 RepID=UPI00065E7F3A|nr:1,2-phenylacetyl-CoA epoxidase subunit PaaB [Rubeoparvulum massiliense]